MLVRYFLKDFEMVTAAPIIIIIIIIISFMQGIYTYIAETNYVPREYSVAEQVILPSLRLLCACEHTCKVNIYQGRLTRRLLRHFRNTFSICFFPPEKWFSHQFENVTNTQIFISNISATQKWTGEYGVARVTLPSTLDYSYVFQRLSSRLACF